MLDDQRLVSLDTLLTLGDALAEKAQGKQPAEYMILLARQTREFEMPRPIFTNGERSEWAAGIYNNHHTDVQMRADMPRVLKSHDRFAGTNRGGARAARIFPPRYSGGFELCLLRAAGCAGAAQ